MEQLVTIEIFGRPYTFKAESEEKHAKEVADYVVKEVNKVETLQSSHSSNITKLATIILAALNIANENIDIKRDRTDFLKNISNRSTKLIHRLDAIV